MEKKNCFNFYIHRYILIDSLLGFETTFHCNFGTELK